VQRVIVEIQGGKLAGTKRVLVPGSTLRVGRRQRADLVVPDDQMSAPHFEISWDGIACRVQDLASQKGTLVGGQKVPHAELQNGSWIRAGSSDFLVFFEEATPPPVDHDAQMDEEDLPPLAAEWRRQNRSKLEATAQAREEAARAALAALGSLEGLHAVIDAARDDRTLILLQESVEEYRSLYEGLEGDALAHVAPYLVSLPPGSRLLGRLVAEGWGKRWASYLTCDRPFKDVRRHLRRFLMVADADTRERFYFRFYDPGVLRTFIPNATPRQMHEFFGPISAFHLEGEHGELVRFEAPAGDEEDG
jgi:pSer/pThr/pTyr-binding forkhead associated (FHA) protein